MEYSEMKTSTNSNSNIHLQDTRRKIPFTRRGVNVPGIADLTGSFSARISDAAPGQRTTVNLVGNSPNEPVVPGSSKMLRAPDFQISNRFVSYPEGAGTFHMVEPRRAPADEPS
jgi:hypothetical protein